MAVPQDNSIQKTILLVDDDPDNLKLLAKMLTENKFQIRASNSGRYALKSIQKNSPDLILLDINMPGIDGYEVCRQLKADPLSADIPIIFISGLKDEESKVRGFEVGGVDYITKPFQSQEILARVRTHLSMSRMKHHLEEVVRERTAELQAATEQFQRLFELASDAFLIIDFEGKIINMNQQSCKKLGYTREEILQLNFADIAIDFSREQIVELCYGVEEKGRLILEGLHRRKDGSTFPVEVGLGLFQQEPKLILSIARDITKRKQSDQQIKASLNEKEILLKEIHHRVKNNMAMVSSFLQFQINRIENQEYLQMFIDTQNRVYTMALVHEKLYKTKDFSNISFQEYIHNLAESLISSFSIYPNQIALAVEINDIALELTKAIPCGLIINELLSNAF
ncbi:MAG: response regulator, partial [Candidatus Electrothrix sp. AR3]|nr:response regulator [Candidatus Electrothrix sp. AR3]